jgi:hypothetical protein
MSNKVCPQCSCTDIAQDWYTHDQGICFVCNICGFVGDAAEFRDQTLFLRITTSPEVLADKLVYKTLCVAVNRVTYSCWKSTITEEAYRTKEEAIAATVAKLKEA